MKRAFRVAGIVRLVLNDRFVCLVAIVALAPVGKIESRTAKSSAASSHSRSWFLIPVTAVKIPARCAAVLEKDLTLDVAQRVDRLLNAEGIATFMTRVGDGYVSLADRAAIANRAQNCIFVSIHFNEGNNNAVASGVETITPNTK